jgi:hypothetical protein
MLRPTLDGRTNLAPIQHSCHHAQSSSSGLIMTLKLGGGRTRRGYRQLTTYPYSTGVIQRIVPVYSIEHDHGLNRLNSDWEVLCMWWHKCWVGAVFADL